MTGRRPILAACLAVALAGCGGKADVTGRVTHQGKALTGGTVSMIGPDGLARQGGINPDGTYKVAGVTAGQVKVGVTWPKPGGGARSGGGGRPGASVRTAGAAAAPADAADWFPIPEKYQDPMTSGLSTTLKSGTNTYDIVLP